jgi:hypothetical protein
MSINCISDNKTQSSRQRWLGKAPSPHGISEERSYSASSLGCQERWATDVVCWHLVCDASEYVWPYRWRFDNWERFPITASTKQKLNTRSSTESELVGVDDMMPIIIWTRYFLLSQGYGIIENLLLQDNRSFILLKQNERALSSKRTRHINI